MFIVSSVLIVICCLYYSEKFSGKEKSPLFSFLANFLFIPNKFYGFKCRQVIYHPTFCGVIFNKINSLGMYDFQGEDLLNHPSPSTKQNTAVEHTQKLFTNQQGNARREKLSKIICCFPLVFLK